MNGFNERPTLLGCKESEASMSVASNTPARKLKRRGRRSAKPSGKGMSNECKVEERRGWDSNPRYSCPYSGFRDRPIQPLWHLSS